MLFRLDNPQTPEEWHTAVIYAAHELMLDRMKREGKIGGTIVFDVDGASAVLQAGKTRGFVPPDDLPQ